MSFPSSYGNVAQIQIALSNFRQQLNHLNTQAAQLANIHYNLLSLQANAINIVGSSKSNPQAFQIIDQVTNFSQGNQAANFPGLPREQSKVDNAIDEVTRKMESWQQRLDSALQIMEGENEFFKTFALA